MLRWCHLAGTSSSRYYDAGTAVFAVNLRATHLFSLEERTAAPG